MVDVGSVPHSLKKKCKDGENCVETFMEVMKK